MSLLGRKGAGLWRTCLSALMVVLIVSDCSCNASSSSPGDLDEDLADATDLMPRPDVEQRGDEVTLNPCGVRNHCEPACEDRVCGDDGCGGVCGFCDPGSFCREDDGTCECVATCFGKECGDDGCGEGCGECGEGLTCAGTFCIDKGEMLSVPAGSFWMGCNDNAHDIGCHCDCHPSFSELPPADNCPYHEVVVPEYRIDALETTVGEFLNFLHAHGNSCDGHVCADLPSSTIKPGETTGTWRSKDEDLDLPADLVTWFGARAYCKWVGKRLCTEAEWEKAARGGCEFYEDCARESRIFPWGYSLPTCDKAHYNKCEGKLAVGSLPSGASPYGALDMAGSQPEWVEDGFVGDYTDAPTDGGSAYSEGGGGLRMFRGGGSSFGLSALLVSSRNLSGPDHTSQDRGIRCCADK